MPIDPFEIHCPSWLDDEALFIETSGEMPEVALAESLANLPALSTDEKSALGSAVARAYLDMLFRDLNPKNIGNASFRGPARALVNLGRLKGFLRRQSWNLPEERFRKLKSAWETYLETEEKALRAKRPYATFSGQTARDLIKIFGAAGKWNGLLKTMDNLPVPDHLGLRALTRLGKKPAELKRKSQKNGRLVIETLDQDGGIQARAALNLENPNENIVMENMARGELVWKLAPGRPL